MSARTFVVTVSDSARRVVIQDVRSGRRAVATDLRSVGAEIAGLLTPPPRDREPAARADGPAPGPR